MLNPNETVLDWHHLPDDMAEELSHTAQISQAVKGSGAAQSLDALSRLAMREALESSEVNVSQAARVLGVSRQTLYRKLKD